MPTREINVVGFWCPKFGEIYSDGSVCASHPADDSHPALPVVALEEVASYADEYADEEHELAKRFADKPEGPPHVTFSFAARFLSGRFRIAALRAIHAEVEKRRKEGGT